MEFSRSLNQVLEVSKKAPITVGYLMDVLKEKGHCLLISVFVLPFLQPLPTGLSTPFGLCIALMGLFLMLGLTPWVPEKFRKLNLSSELALKCIEVAEKFSKKVELLIRPRWLWLVHSKIAQIFLGLLILLNGFFLALPLPIPFTNAIPAWCLLIMAVSQIEEDGICMLVGMLLGALSTAFFIVLGPAIYIATVEIAIKVQEVFLKIIALLS
jgi:hypothetical protein